MKQLFSRILLFWSLGMILASVSELFFYPVEIDYWFYWFILLYWLYAYFTFLLLSFYKIKSFAWMFIAASIFWFLIEGWLLGVLYESLPFSLVWTSLAWHTLISWVLFFYIFRKKLISKSYSKALLYNIFLGALLWLWGTYSWNAVEIVWSMEILFEWKSVSEYAFQVIIAYTVFIFGHILYERGITSLSNVSSLELKIVAWVVALSFLAWNAILYFPFSLILLPLIYGCYIALKKSRHLAIDDTIFVPEKISISKYITTLIIPATSILIYAIFFYYKIELEMNALYFTVWWIISVYLFLKFIYASLNYKYALIK